MSEKKLILFSILGIILMSIILMYQMVNKDIQKEKRIVAKEAQDIQIIPAPKIEIETRK